MTIPLTFILFTSFATAQMKEAPVFTPNTTLPYLEEGGVQSYCINSSTGPSLRVEVGTSHDWPFATLVPEGGFDFSDYGSLSFPVTNSGHHPVQVYCVLESQLPDKPESLVKRQFSIELDVSAAGVITIPLVEHTMPANLKREDFFGMRGLPFFHIHSLHLKHITSIKFYLKGENVPRAFLVGPWLLNSPPRSGDKPNGSPLPFIDEFGQYVHRDWPGKTGSLQQMRDLASSQAKLLDTTPPPAPWNQYGGHKEGTQHEATGFFRVANYEGKWILIDPEGKPFFSLGVDHVGYSAGTIINERETWFEQLPADDEEHQRFYSTWKPDIPSYHFYDKDSRVFNFHRYNIMRKYGENWEQKFLETTARRLPAWGVNTLGCWSDPKLFPLRKTPYVGFLKPRGPAIEGSSGHWGPFLDVFHPEFAASLERLLAREVKAQRTSDPWMIGYFVDNELSWGDATSLALGTLKSPPTQRAKIVFIADLKAKYTEIAKLNSAWQSNYASWEALSKSTTPPAIEPARADLEAFVIKLSNTYFRKVAQALEKHAPNHLYLGCRFMKGADNYHAVQACAKHCDVVSFNAYVRYLSEALPSFDLAGNKPIIIGEFHFGALDRGMLHTGLVDVADQEERAQAFTQYVTDCISHPNIVGCHWFQYADSPTTGRQWDGENYQIGFTDTADTPYPEIIAASRKIGEKLYE
ncbi:MAG: beta-galactosidase [Roseibacillus sp.]